MRGFPSSQGEASGEVEPREGVFRALSPSSETVVHPGFGTQTNDALETLDEGFVDNAGVEWVAMPSSRPRDQTSVSYVSCTGSGFFTTSTSWEAQYAL